MGDIPAVAADIYRARSGYPADKSLLCAGRSGTFGVVPVIASAALWRLGVVWTTFSVILRWAFVACYLRGFRLLWLFGLGRGT